MSEKIRLFDHLEVDVFAIDSPGEFLRAMSTPGSLLRNKVELELSQNELYKHDLKEWAIREHWIVIQDILYHEKMAARDQLIQDRIKEEIAKSEAIQLAYQQQELDKKNKKLLSDDVVSLTQFILGLEEKNKKLDTEITRWTSDIPTLQKEFKQEWNNLQKTKEQIFINKVKEIGGLKDIKGNVVDPIKIAEAMRRPALLDVLKINPKLQARIDEHVTDLVSAMQMANVVCNGDNCFRQLNCVLACAVPGKKEEEKQSTIEKEDVAKNILALIRKQKAEFSGVMKPAVIEDPRTGTVTPLHQLEVENVKKQILSTKPGLQSLQIAALKAQREQNLVEIAQAQDQISGSKKQHRLGH